MMSKEAKKNYVEEMKKNFTDNESVMIARYQGLNVNELDALRKELREKGILFKITKNKITKIALKETSKKDLEKYFSGPTAAAISSDPISTAKILTKFSKSNDKLKIVAGFMDGKVLDEKEVSVIATLPTLEEARAKIVGILATPAQKLVSILLAPGSKIANLARKSLKINHRTLNGDLNKIIDELSTLTVVEAAELSKQLEENGALQRQSSCGSTSRWRCTNGWRKIGVYFLSFSRW